MKRIVVIGAGFAGLWAAIGAARKLDELGIGADEVSVTVVNRDRWHGIRVRNYEPDLSDVRVALDDVLGPVGVSLVVGNVEGIDVANREVTVVNGGGAAERVPYDRLVLGAGSQLNRPSVPGLAEYAFDIDTFDAADRLDRHVRALGEGAETVVIVGGGLTGVELACEMPGRLRDAGVTTGRVILLDRQPHIGSNMGDEAVPVIGEALAALGVETRTAVAVERIDGDGVVLGGGERIPARTVVWSAGMRASPLAEMIPGERDGAGRLRVDPYLRVEGVPGVLAAGDVASARLGDGHATVMSCQHARPMGRLAGHNAVSDLLERDDLLPLDIDYYVTCLDLGPWGALFTEGWDRRVASKGPEVKTVKQTINCDRIYPPRAGDRREILDAAAPVIQTPPPTRAAE
jgi:NADH dehydrogenase